MKASKTAVKIVRLEQQLQTERLRRSAAEDAAAAAQAAAVTQAATPLPAATPATPQLSPELQQYRALKAAGDPHSEYLARTLIGSSPALLHEIEAERRGGNSAA